jgi:hypothetical protein
MYLRNIPFEAEFDGGKVVATLKPLSFDDFLQVGGISDGLSDEDKGLELARMFMPKMKEYILKLEGVKDADGVDVPIDEIVTVSYFVNLVVKMIVTIVNSSTPPQKPAELSAS